jgi:hypothetical protein
MVGAGQAGEAVDSAVLGLETEVVVSVLALYHLDGVGVEIDEMLGVLVGDLPGCLIILGVADEHLERLAPDAAHVGAVTARVLVDVSEEEHSTLVLDELPPLAERVDVRDLLARTLPSAFQLFLCREDPFHHVGRGALGKRDQQMNTLGMTGRNETADLHTRQDRDVVASHGALRERRGVAGLHMVGDGYESQLRGNEGVKVGVEAGFPIQFGRIPFRDRAALPPIVAIGRVDVEGGGDEASGLGELLVEPGIEYLVATGLCQSSNSDSA